MATLLEFAIEPTGCASLVVFAPQAISRYQFFILFLNFQ